MEKEYIFDEWTRYAVRCGLPAEFKIYHVWQILGSQHRPLRNGSNGRPAALLETGGRLYFLVAANSRRTFRYYENDDAVCLYRIEETFADLPEVLDNLSTLKLWEVTLLGDGDKEKFSRRLRFCPLHNYREKEVSILFFGETRYYFHKECLGCGGLADMNHPGFTIDPKLLTIRD